MRFEAIASGSSGNCIYAGSDTTHLIIDCGISRKKTRDALKELGLSGRDLSGILITHEHSDHVSGLRLLAADTDCPIYATRATIDSILGSQYGAGIDPERFMTVRSDEPFMAGDLKIAPMHISHDAADPVGYRIFYGSRKISICTDLGCYDAYTRDCLQDSDVLLLEANHDIRMLQAGPYPYRLKQRILGDRGHLSNAASGKLISEILHPGIRQICLGHLSKENNLPELAYETVRVELLMKDIPYRADELPIRVAKRSEPSGVVEF